MEDVVTPNDILQIKGNKWFYKGQELSEQQILAIRTDADFIRKSSLWKIMVDEGKYHAQKRAMINAKEEKDKAKRDVILNEAWAYHDVVVFFEQFIKNITK